MVLTPGETVISPVPFTLALESSSWAFIFIFSLPAGTLTVYSRTSLSNFLSSSRPSIDILDK